MRIARSALEFCRTELAEMIASSAKPSTMRVTVISLMRMRSGWDGIARDEY
jgi:hypothetical protein